MWTYGEFDPVIKSCLIVLALLVAIKCGPRRIGLVRRAKRGFRRIAAKPWCFSLVIIAVCFALNGLMTSIFYPQPRVHDEFAYLLASDTFASGRLTNERHPMQEHFETFHVLSDPSYMAKYPPANGLVLALGQRLTGHPLVGVWISFTLACLAFYWMLRSWTSAQWAAVGGLLLAANGPLIRAWGQTYWGGSIALMGGALISGGLHRIWNAHHKTNMKPKTSDAILLGLGLITLANSRPMEGLFVALPVIAALLIWYVREQEVSWTYKTFRIAAPIVSIGIVGLALMGTYNKAVTGDMTKMPYAVHDTAYSASSLALWKTPPEIPSYTHPRMRRFYLEFGRERQLEMRTPAVYTRQLLRKLRLLWNYLPIGIGLSLIPAFFLWKDPWWRMSLCIVGSLLLVHTQLAASWIYPHYIAPALALFFAINVQCLRHLRIWQRQLNWGPVLTRTFLVLAFLKLAPTIIIWTAAPLHTPRAEIENRLVSESENGGSPQHLVICSYGDDYPIVSDWVYNAADIDASQIVWARDMGESKNAKLIEYYAGRKVWRCCFENDESMTLRVLEQADTRTTSKPNNQIEKVLATSQVAE